MKNRDDKILHEIGASWSPTPNGEIFEQFLGNGVGSEGKIIPKFLTGWGLVLYSPPSPQSPLYINMFLIFILSTIMSINNFLIFM